MSMPTSQQHAAQFQAKSSFADHTRVITFRRPTSSTWFAARAFVIAISSATVLLASACPVNAYSPSGTLAISGVPVAGPDENIWALQQDLTGINLNRQTPGGETASFPIRGIYDVSGIEVGADGRFWISADIRLRGGNAASGFVAVTPSGHQKRFPLKGVRGEVFPLAVGRDGNVWFSGPKNRLGRISPRGRVSFVHVPHAGEITDATQGSDGAIWAVVPLNTGSGDFPFDKGKALVERITPNGRTTQLPIRSADEVAVGPNGDLWFDGWGALQHLSPHGKLTQVPIGKDLIAASISTLPDGKIGFFVGPVDNEDPTGWMTTDFGTSSQSGRVTWHTADVPNDGNQILGFAVAAPDGRILFDTGDILTNNPPIAHVAPSVGLAAVRTKRGALYLKMKCRAMAGTYCTGRVDVKIGTRKLRARTFGIAPFNRLDQKINLNSAKRGSTVTLTITTNDPISGQTRRIRRTLRSM
jgi:streptogramin lyase